MPKKKVRRIAVLGGGGAKGRIQIVALAKKEKDVGPLYEYYDLMVGTSVGAINAAAIASGNITAFDMERLYSQMLNQVFKKRPWYQRLKLPLYDRKNFVTVWLDLVGNIFMKDCKTKLLVTSVDRCSDRNHYFKSWTGDGKSFLVSDVCKSFAAPLYFGQINDSTNKCVWFDGGVGNSNISLEEALAEAMLLGWQDDEIHVDVYGCGYVDTTVPYKKASRQRTVRQLLDFMKPQDGGLARAQSREDKVSRMIKFADSFKDLHFDYWDVKIDKKYDGMDKIKYLKKYKAYGEVMAKSPIISV